MTTAPTDARNPKEELEDIEKQLEALEARRRDIYKASLTAPEEVKVCADWEAKILSGDPLPTLKYPVPLHGITWADVPMLKASTFGGDKSGSWVAVRPVSGEGANKTFLGILLGSLALGASCRYDRASGVLAISPTMHNPATWVPDLGQLVFGCGSFWKTLKKPEDLKQITDADINNVWYVRAMKELTARASADADGGKEPT